MQEKYQEKKSDVKDDKNIPEGDDNSDCSSLTDEGFAEQMFKPLDSK